MDKWPLILNWHEWFFLVRGGNKRGFLIFLEPGWQLELRLQCLFQSLFKVTNGKKNPESLTIIIFEIWPFEIGTLGTFCRKRLENYFFKSDFRYVGRGLELNVSYGKVSLNNALFYGAKKNSETHSKFWDMGLLKQEVGDSPPGPFRGFLKTKNSSGPPFHYIEAEGLFIER